MRLFDAASTPKAAGASSGPGLSMASSPQAHHSRRRGLRAHQCTALFVYAVLFFCSFILERGPDCHFVEFGSGAELKPKRSDQSHTSRATGSDQRPGSISKGYTKKEVVGLSPKRPVPLPEDRVLKALSMFEEVHSQMTLFFKGFSRQGSVIAYDLLNELRTVKEATLMMDVEFLVLDRVMDYYNSPTHLRVVDTTVFSKLLNFSNLLPWKIPGLLSDIRRLVVEYQPVLQQFLNRYDPVIEALILINVPRALARFRPLMAALIGVPREKLIFAMTLRDLEKYIPLKDIPREFWNPRGGPVRDGRENRVSWRIMLEEVEAKLGVAALKPAGKLLLQQIREEEAAVSTAPGTSEAGLLDGHAPDGQDEDEEFPDFDEGVVNDEIPEMPADFLLSENGSPEGTKDGLTSDVLDADFDDID